ncbi:MAG: DNA-binding response regulator [Acidobacteria bacterium]|nr:MAG: DNA-binding response regulator [Acidobacteriota bacterium]
MTQRVLLVEDDASLGRQVTDRLRAAGFEPTWVRDGQEALAVSPEPFALLILDLMLPGAHGFDVLKKLRGASDVPVLVLSARNDAHDKVRALELGADDYVTKPFWPEELVARIQARLRRPALQRSSVVEVGELTIDTHARQVWVGGEEVELTRVEFDLLAALSRRVGAAVARAWLVEHVLDPNREGGERTLDVHVSRLRKKLGAGGRFLTTVWGVGYRLDRPART